MSVAETDQSGNTIDITGWAAKSNVMSGCQTGLTSPAALALLVLDILLVPRHGHALEISRQSGEGFAHLLSLQRTPMAGKHELGRERRQPPHRLARVLPVGREIHRWAMKLGPLGRDGVRGFLPRRDERVTSYECFVIRPP